MYKQMQIGNLYLDYLVYNDGRVYSVRSKRFLKPIKNSDGYLRVYISQKDIGFKKYVSIHRIVAETFIPNPENKPQVNHINGIKTDNRVENLEWVTAKENTVHAYVLGLAKGKVGEDNSAAKYSEALIIRICELLNEGKYTSREIATMLDVSLHLIANVRCGIAWAHISKNYPNITKQTPRFVRFHDFVDCLIKQGKSTREILAILVDNEGLTRKEGYNLIHSRKRKLFKLAQRSS